jgi:plasmid stabilization system protein ParE
VNPILTPEAAAEMHEAADWYDGQRDGLGDELMDEVNATIREIAADPTRFPRYEGRQLKPTVRRALVNRFPYVVSFEVVNDIIWILAVFHGHRRPGYWRNRGE